MQINQVNGAFTNIKKQGGAINSTHTKTSCFKGKTERKVKK